jgi:ribose-phosphate pyrophosphokinase
MPVQIRKNDKPCLYKQWTFPGGEVGVQLLDTDITDRDEIWITIQGIPTSEDMFVAANLLNAIRNVNSEAEVNLYMPYIPYARQDRVCNKGESFGLMVYFDMMQYMFADVDHFTTVDPHSHVAEDLVKSFECTIIPQHMMAGSILDSFDYDILIAPDKGATEKAKKFNHKNLVTLSKSRTSEGIKYDDYEYDTLSGSVLVVDDIGDGLGTFISLIEMLKRTQPRITKYDLYVTHGIFSKGVEVAFKAGYNQVFTANNMKELGVHSYKVKE